MYRMTSALQVVLLVASRTVFGEAPLPGFDTTVVQFTYTLFLCTESSLVAAPSVIRGSRWPGTAHPLMSCSDGSEVGRALVPLKPYRSGLPLRFHLQDITRVAHAVELQSIVAAALAEIHSGVGRGDEGSRASLQRLRVDERLRMHRLLVQKHATRLPPQAMPLGQNFGPSARVRGAPQVQRRGGQPSNYWHDAGSYWEVFRQGGAAQRRASVVGCA